MSAEESENQTGPKRNPWDGYGLMILRARLGWIKGCNPKIYRYYDRDGNEIGEVNGEQWQVMLEYHRAKGLKVELQDNRKIIAELEDDIRAVEVRYYSKDADK